MRAEPERKEKTVYEVKMGDKSAHIFYDGREVAQAVKTSLGVYYAMIDENGKAWGYDHERVTLSEWAGRFSGEVVA